MMGGLEEIFNSNNRSKSHKLNYQTNKGKQDCSIEVLNLFNKLSSWREESYREIGNIIKCHSASVSKAINDMAEELSITARERNDFAEMVKNLRHENRQLSDKLSIGQQPLTEEFDTHDNGDVQKVEAVEMEVSVVKSDIEGHIPYVFMPEVSFQESSEKDSISNELANSNINDFIEQVTPDEEVTDHKEYYFDGINREEIPFSKLVQNESNNLKNNVCDECGNSYSGKTSLIRHELSVHKKGKLFKCEQCSHTTTRKDHLKEHIEWVHDNIKSHICKECGYAAARKSTLKEHMQHTHKMGVKQFKCEKCPYAAIAKGDLKKHTEGVHEKIRNHVCGECGYAASRKGTLKSHRDVDAKRS